MAAYALAGFLIAPFAIKLWIESPNVSGPSCRLRVQEVYVNPFTMFLSLENVTLFEQENKLYISATRAETRALTVEMLRAEGYGRDVAIRNLVVTSTDSDESLLAVPTAFARSVTVGAAGPFIDAAHVRLERPDAAMIRDPVGIRHQPAWLSVPGDERTGACISVDGFKALGGRLRMTDESVTPSVQLVLSGVMAEARPDRDRDAMSTEVDVEGRFGATGTISITGELRGPTGRYRDVFSMNARNVELQALSPYFRRSFGRDIVAGSGSATLRHERDAATLRLDSRLTVAGLRLGGADENVTDETRPLELALALATDAADRGEFSFQGSVSDSNAQAVVGLFTDSLAAHFDDLAAMPFEVLARLAGDADAVLDDIAFEPGSAEMAPEAAHTLPLLALALDQRPRLGLRVRPAYDPSADRDAIAAQQVRLHIALATSKGAREGGHTTDPDFSDPRVQDVLDEFGGARLTEAQRRAITRDASDESTMYRNIYLALVANEPVSETVLRRLARFRARSVIDALQREGIDRDRFRIADALDTRAADAGRPSLKLELQVRPAARDPDTRNGAS